MKFKASKLLFTIVTSTIIISCNVLTIPFLSADSIKPITEEVSKQNTELLSLASEEEALIIELYKRVNPAVVNIATYITQQKVIVQSGQGSGFVFDQEGHIVTNSHVIHGADQIEIYFSDNSTSGATIIGEDLHSDLAVIKVDKLPSGIQNLPLGSMDDLAVGQTVLAIGNPFGLGGTLTKGIISALGRTIPALTAFSIPQSIQTDAPINPGNSGGPLLNLKGEVIGVNAQIETDGASRVNSGIGFAIPISIMERVIPELITNGVYKWSWLGVTGRTLDPSLIEVMGLKVNQGAYISQVVEDGPSALSGLQGAEKTIVVNGRQVEIGGDVIVGIDDMPVNSFEDLLIYTALNTVPGQAVTLRILRDNKEMEIIVTVQERPSSINLMP